VREYVIEVVNFYILYMYIVQYILVLGKDTPAYPGCIVCFQLDYAMHDCHWLMHCVTVNVYSQVNSFTEAGPMPLFPSHVCHGGGLPNHTKINIIL